MFGNAGYVIGQILGMVAVAVGFISYQMKTPRKILIFEIITAIVFSAHYFFIGAMTAMALNMVSVLQCVAYYLRDKRGSKGMVMPVLFTICVTVTGLLNWEGWYSLLVTAGLAVYSIGIAFPRAQAIRYAMFIKSPLCLLYNILAGSFGGILYEGAVLVSSIIGTARYRKEHVQ